MSTLIVDNWVYAYTDYSSTKFNYIFIQFVFTLLTSFLIYIENLGVHNLGWLAMESYIYQLGAGQP